jgi:hypothetical protein
MGISYEPSSKKWNVVYEKTDYKTDYPSDGPNSSLNQTNAGLNEENRYKNEAYDKVVSIASGTNGGDYTKQREVIRNIANVNQELKTTLEKYYKTFYSTEKLQQWDTRLGAKPPYGEFDSSYYKTQNPAASQQWASAVANDDIDITKRYGEDGFYLQHYTTQGKPAGARGNKTEVTIAANQYLEKTPTDVDIQNTRTNQLTPAATYTNAELEASLAEIVQKNAITDIKRVGALTQDALKQTIDEMKKAKAREQEISMFKGFGDLGEIMNINTELENSILGDSGIGGALSFMGGEKARESFGKSLSKVTGVNVNNTVYNWQQWFDEALKTRYETDIEVGYTEGQAEERIKVEADFSKQFIDEYLVPRFNESRSMDEFIGYLDSKQTTQNPFQTQDAFNAARLISDMRARSYLDQLKASPGSYFDSDFYFNPKGLKTREAEYSTQASTVAADWEAAKKGDEYWKSQAYRFGVDITDKDAFARLHFQVKGQEKGYDPADDVLNAIKVSDYIYTQLLPTLKEGDLEPGSIFGQFITPDEFANEMLRGLDPNNKNTWEEVLKRYGTPGFNGSIDDLKNNIKESLRTGSAQEIRDSIAYLNEKNQKPTQKDLGITYIERPEDYVSTKTEPETELYKTFQSAGFQGTEDDFFKDFFPDMDRNEQVLLTKSGKNDTLKTFGLDLSNPFASLGTVENLFTSDEPEKTTAKPEPKTNSYFRIAMGEDEDEPTTKSKSGSAILDEFTSMFKGL